MKLTSIISSAVMLAAASAAPYSQSASNFNGGDGAIGSGIRSTDNNNKAPQLYQHMRNGSNSIAGPIVNDYPWKNTCSGNGPSQVDPWNFWQCQCASFVAFRVRDRLNLDFDYEYMGAHWGDAKTWDEAARQVGIRTDQYPAAGSLAQLNRGGQGHIAWVHSVSNDGVLIEEYNAVTPYHYSTRMVAPNEFDNYIHIAG
ncbi:hypothetical protein F4780DRAFT_430732 [Xylariomycetidae sp. FL0641]|nr:hypothetical protein F4780DRAFT_430732 [Xylariomycetidae sp. FL0641]